MESELLFPFPTESEQFLKQLMTCDFTKPHEFKKINKDEQGTYVSLGYALQCRSIIQAESCERLIIKEVIQRNVSGWDSERSSSAMLGAKNVIPEGTSTPARSRSTMDDLAIRYGMASSAGPIRTRSRDVIPVCVVKRRQATVKDVLNRTVASLQSSSSSSSGFEGFPRMSSNLRAPRRMATSLIAHTGHSEDEPEKLALPAAKAEAGSF